MSPATIQQPTPGVSEFDPSWPKVIERVEHEGAFSESYGDAAPTAGWLRLKQDMQARRLGGWAKYGEDLRPFNGRDSMVDLYQELLDGAVYAENDFAETNDPDSDWMAEMLMRLAFRVNGIIHKRKTLGRELADVIREEEAA